MSRLLPIGCIIACVAGFGCHSERRTLEVDGVSREYLLTIPESLPTGPAPLLLALHQFSDSAEGMRKLTGFDQLAQENGFVVAYPQGRWRVWNSRGDRDVDDVKFLLAMVEAIDAERAVDRSRIYATGISAGGMMAQYLACNSDLLAALASVAGSQPAGVLGACARTSPIPALMIHGDEDAIVPYDGGDVSTGGGDATFASARANADTWARKNGCAEGEPLSEILPPRVASDPSRVTRYTYSCPSEGPVLFYSVGQGGHTWPGRDNWYPAFIVGGTSQQLDASRVIWEFVSAHRKP